MTRNFNDWLIKVQKCEGDNNVFVAEFYIPKTDGSKWFQQFYKYIGNSKTTHSFILERVKRIIETFYQ